MFIDIKSLGSKQVWYIQKLSKYNFEIDYYQDRVNVAANALFKFLFKKHKREKYFESQKHVDFILIAVFYIFITDFNFEVFLFYYMIICEIYILP